MAAWSRFGLRGVLIRNTLTGAAISCSWSSAGARTRSPPTSAQESLEVVAWLDSTDALDALRARLGDAA